MERRRYIRGRGNALTQAVPLPHSCKAVVGGACGRLWVLDLRSGRIDREIDLGSALLATPLVHDDGAVTIADFDGYVHHFCAGTL